MTPKRKRLQIQRAKEAIVDYECSSQNDFSMRLAKKAMARMENKFHV